jgi:acyl carrier protein
MQAVQELIAPTAPSLQYDVMREIFTLLAPYSVGGKPITPQTVISKGLTVDSLTIMDVIMELEDRFDVTIPMKRHRRHRDDRPARGSRRFAARAALTKLPPP